MAIQLIGSGTAVVEVDASHKASRVSVLPIEVLSYGSMGTQSGALTGLAAGSPLFSFRNSGTNLILVKRLGVGFITTTAFTTAQIVDFGLMVARAFTVSDSGGTQVSLTGSNCKHRTSLGTVTSSDMRVATTGALTPGTRTLDTNYLAQTGGWSGAVGAGMTALPDNLFSHNTGDYPLVLAANEGLVVTNVSAFGAAGVGRLYVNLEFAEATSY